MTTATLDIRRREWTAPDERAARRALRAQLARLEAELGAQTAERRPLTFAELLRAPAGVGESRPRPRLLGIEELEAARDELAARLRAQRAEAAALADRQEEQRRLREEMLADPAAHPYARVSNTDIGEPGCHDWHVRPRFGLLGLLMRWWRVRISSGCP